MTDHVEPTAAPTAAATQPASISPSSLGVFFALDQCRRFLRLALMSRDERDGNLSAVGVTAEQIPPTLSVEGRTFEKQVEEALRRTVLTPRLHRSEGDDTDGGVEQSAPDLVARIGRVASGRTVVFGQHKLSHDFDRWSISGQPDLVVASKDEEGRLSLLVCDVKASKEPRLEHRLQVALYGRMLASLLPDATIEQAVLYRRPSILPTEGEELTNVRRDELAAHDRLGLDVALLSIADGGEIGEYDAMLDRILLGDGSEAARTLEEELDDLPFHVERKCDVCAYNELCLKRCRETGDLSLVPHLDGQDKAVLRLHGVETVGQLAAVGLAGDDLRQRLRSTWPVGPRLGELTERAQSYLKWQREDVEASEYLTERGYSTLPAVSARQHPNLVQIFVDAQLYDPDERLYMLGALVRVHRDGALVPNRQRWVVKVLPVPPRADADERGLLTSWIIELLGAVRDLAFPIVAGDRHEAPIHLYMFEENTKQVLLGAIQRHADAVFGVDALFTLLTQRAAYETGNLSVVGAEVERQWNLPMLCQSLQAVATYRGFKWDADGRLRRIFKHRFFDQLGRIETDDDQPLYAPRRSRFKSDLPIEYPFIAWGLLASADLTPKQRETFSRYNAPSIDDLKALGAARLDAMAYLVDKLRPNTQTTKIGFDLAQIVAGVGTLREGSALSAMKNFVVVERHVVLNAWRAAHILPPERRVLSGDTLIGVYRDADQEVGVRVQLRQSWEEHGRSVLAWEAKRDTGEEGNRPYPPAWSPPEVTVRLELTREALDADPEQAIRRSDLKAGSWVAIAPRWTVDTRPDAPFTDPYTPTPRQLMLALKGEITRFVTEGGRSWAEVVLKAGVGKETTGFTFGAYLAEMFEDGGLYTLDENPSSPSDANRLTIVEAVEGGLPHPFAEWLDARPSITADWPVQAAEAQRRFYDGLMETELLTEETDKERYIAEHGADPVLLVQGPPGTGKSFTTAFAVLARIQGAMAADLPYAVAVSCATHAATDVVLGKIAQTRDRLRDLAQTAPVAFTAHFDARVLDVAVIRSPQGDWPDYKKPPDGCRHFSNKSPGAWANEVARIGHVVVGGTPSQIKRLGREALKGKHGPCFDLCVIDEASQMTAPDALQATVGLKPTGRVVFVGDHRQMPPIVHNDWERESEVSFDPYAMHRSIFDFVRQERPRTPQEKFARSFRLQPDVAEYLRREIYAQDGIDYHSFEPSGFDAAVEGSPLVEAILNGGHALVVVRHDERGSQQRNELEAAIIREIYLGLEGRRVSRLERRLEVGVVVPHRAQRADVRDVLVRTFGRDELAEDVDTVERFQGGEREVIVVSATESDPAYLRLAGAFLFDPRRLTVAISRARQKLIVVASRSVFDYLPPDLEALRDTALWRNLLDSKTTERVWEGELDGHRVEVFGNLPLVDRDILA